MNYRIKNFFQKILCKLGWHGFLYYGIDYSVTPNKVRVYCSVCGINRPKPVEKRVPKWPK